MKKELLNIEVRILIEKYGYRNILEYLSKVKGTSISEIEAMINSLEARSTRTRKRKKKKDILEIAEKVISGNENWTLLHELARKYQNKIFLPQLKDVRRFLEQSGIDTQKLKSRVDSTKIVFGVLIKLPLQELESLLSEIPEKGESAFSALASEIIGDHPNRATN